MEPKTTARSTATWISLCLLVVSVALVALAACQDQPEQLNPEGYPPIPEGRAPAPAPIEDGPILTPVGAIQPPGAPQGAEEGGVAVVGPAAADPGVYEAMNGTGSAQTTPTATPTPTPEPAETVTITSEGFEPRSITISTGDAVLWRNSTRSPQTVTAVPILANDQTHVALPENAEPWDSGVINSGGEFVHTFDVPGEYVYFSITFEQQGMTGEITVEP